MEGREVLLLASNFRSGFLFLSVWPSSPAVWIWPPVAVGCAPSAAVAAECAAECSTFAVVAVGAWGAVPQSTVDDLTTLGLNLDQTIAALGKVDGILLTANYCIYRQRHANTAAAPCAAAGAPRRPRRKHAPSTWGTRLRPRRRRPAATSTASRAQEQGGHTHDACAAAPRLACS